MNRTVYFADRAVAFTAEAPGGAWYAVAAEACGGIFEVEVDGDQFKVRISFPVYGL